MADATDEIIKTEAGPNLQLYGEQDFPVFA